jgi:hypothetical protein
MEAISDRKTIQENSQLHHSVLFNVAHLTVRPSYKKNTVKG